MLSLSPRAGARGTCVYTRPPRLPDTHTQEPIWPRRGQRGLESGRVRWQHPHTLMAPFPFNWTGTALHGFSVNSGMLAPVPQLRREEGLRFERISPLYELQ